MYPRAIGSVVTSSDREYDGARRIWNERFDCRPRAIIYPRDAGEVAAAVCYVRDNSIPFRIRSGGHNVEGFCVVDDGVVIDLSRLASMVVAGGDRTRAVVGPGVLLGDLYANLWSAGVTIPAGVCPDIRIGGHVLGGGIGMLVRSRGMLIDSLIGLTIVDARGRTLEVDDRRHSDLMWACRGGGGGNFGIVTAYTFRTQPVADVTLVSVKWDWADAIAVLDAWQHWILEADKRVNSRFTLYPSSAGTVTMTVLFEGPADEWQSIVWPLVGRYPPLEYSIRAVPFMESVGTFSEVVPSVRAKFVPALAEGPLDALALKTIERWHRGAPAGVKTGFYGLGGAVLDGAAAERSAFPHRGALLCVEYLGHWANPDHDSEHLEWLAGIRSEMHEFMTGGAYINSPDRDLVDWLHAYYGDSLPRLMDVKRKYDPHDVFNFEQSIPVSMSLADTLTARLPHAVIAGLRDRDLITA
jgi:FAD/FMN-containing dehydrogenase